MRTTIKAQGPLSILLLLVGGLTVDVHAQSADKYRQAAAAYRDAAAKCPPRSACYNANANYYECLATQLGGAKGQCNAPSCSMTEPACATSGGGAGGGANSTANTIIANNNAQAQAAGAVVQTLGNTISSILASRSAARERERLTAERTEEAKENEDAITAANDAALSAKLEDLRRREAGGKAQDELNAALDAEMKQQAINAALDAEMAKEEEKKYRSGPIDSRLVAGGTPAFPSPFDHESWSPWYYMQTPAGLNITNLQIAIWSGGGGLPSGPRDFPMQWALRNTSNHDMKVDYELFITCISQCAGGWHRYQLTIPAGKTVRGTTVSKYAWSISLWHALKVTP